MLRELLAAQKTTQDSLTTVVSRLDQLAHELADEATRVGKIEEALASKF